MENKMTKLSLEIACTMYNSGIESIKAFALENYPELEKKPLPSTWEELEYIDGYYITLYSSVAPSEGLAKRSSYNVLPTETLAKAILSMCKLQYLKYIYNDGWEPDYETDLLKYNISFSKNKLKIDETWYISRPLTFKSLELAELFLKNFIDDIMIAKELI